MIVTDSNVLAARNFTGMQTALAEKVEKRDPVWIMPPLWRYEFQNILTKGLWAREFTQEGALHVWRVVMARMEGNEHEPSPERVIELSTRYRITAYDANVVALAMEMGVLCVTEDGELQKKFPSLAVSMADFIRQGQPGGNARESRASYGGRKRKPLRMDKSISIRAGTR